MSRLLIESAGEGVRMSPSRNLDHDAADPPGGV
jgi:hypothetical protein